MRWALAFLGFFVARPEQAVARRIDENIKICVRMHISCSRLMLKTLQIFLFLPGPSVHPNTYLILSCPVLCCNAA